jgi:hypothetical protein
MQRDDDQGVLGMRISRDLMGVAGRALRANITTLAPLILPASELILYAANAFARKARPALRIASGIRLANRSWNNSRDRLPSRAAP